MNFGLKDDYFQAMIEGFKTISRKVISGSSEIYYQSLGVYHVIMDAMVEAFRPY